MSNEELEIFLLSTQKRLNDLEDHVRRAEAAIRALSHILRQNDPLRWTQRPEGEPPEPTYGPGPTET